MPYTTPTAADFKARFPSFVSESDARITAFITEANRNVDTSWCEGDYQNAILYLAAHLLAVENAAGSTGVSRVVQSESFGGEISKSYKVADGEEALGLGQTIYGQRYKKLLKLNRTGPVLI